MSILVNKALSSFIEAKTPEEMYDCRVNVSNSQSLSEDEKDELEILRLVKGYLASYLQQILDNPEETIVEAIEKKYEDKIQKLEDKIQDLQQEIENLKISLLSRRYTTSPYYNGGSTATTWEDLIKNAHTV